MAGKHITHSLGLEKNESEEDWSWGISILHSITASAPLTARASAVFPSSYSSCSSSSSSLTHVEEVLSEDEEDLSWNQESKLEFMDLPREVHLAMLQHLSPTELLKLSRVISLCPLTSNPRVLLALWRFFFCRAAKFKQ